MNLFERAIELVFGSKHERDAKRMRPIVEAINARESEIEALDDEALRGRFEATGERVRAAIAELPEDRRERSVMVQNLLDPELEEVFALVREASKRTTGMRHFDVQLMGGVVLHEGRIAEMRILKSAEDVVRLRLHKQRDGKLVDLLDKAMDRTLDPHSAALQLLEGFGENGEPDK